MEKESKTITIFALFTFVLFIFLLFFNLGDPKLTNWDEAWYADISRNIAKEGNLFSQVWNYELFFDASPLYLWFSAFSFKMFGISEFSARFFSALSGLGVGIIIFLLARFLFNVKVALLSLLVLVSTPVFLFRARTGNFDIFLTFWIMLSIFTYFMAMKKSGKWFIRMGMSIGLGFLAKGVIIFLFPIIVIAYHLTQKEYKVLASFWFLKGMSIALLIPFLWFFINIMLYDQKFVSEFFAYQTRKVATTPFIWNNFSLDYLFHLKSGLKLWVFFLPPALYVLWRKEKGRMGVLIPLYFLIFSVILIFSENKSNWFLMPIYPITAIIIGSGIYFATIKFLGKRYIPSLFLILVIVAIFQLFYYKHEYFVADVAGDEARVAQAANRYTQETDRLYLTNYYYPTTVFYSQRKVYAVYSDQEKNASWWIKSKTAWKDILKQKRVFIITTNEEFKNFQEYFSPYKFETLYQSGEKLLIKKV